MCGNTSCMRIPHVQEHSIPICSSTHTLTEPWSLLGLSLEVGGTGLGCCPLGHRQDEEMVGVPPSQDHLGPRVHLARMGYGREGQERGHVVGAHPRKACALWSTGRVAASPGHPFSHNHLRMATRWHLPSACPLWRSLDPSRSRERLLSTTLR